MIDPNQPAFPTVHHIDGNWQKTPLQAYQGLTVRAELTARYVAASLFNADHFTEEEGKAAIKSMIFLADETIRQLNETT